MDYELKDIPAILAGKIRAQNGWNGEGDVFHMPAGKDDPESHFPCWQDNHNSHDSKVVLERAEGFIKIGIKSYDYSHFLSFENESAIRSYGLDLILDMLMHGTCQNFEKRFIFEGMKK